MKIKNKGKVHPSPSSSSPPLSNPTTSTTETDALSVLKLLPAAILALASILSVSDREVLAYMITRSLKTPSIPAACSSSSSVVQDPKKKCKKTSFDCECFDCYTWYWSRWDSSPNRERIHQVIEAFEEHLAANNGELTASSAAAATSGASRKKNTNGKRKEKTQTQQKLQQDQETRNAVAVPAALVVAPVEVNENKRMEEEVVEKVEAEVVAEVVEGCCSVPTAVAVAGGGSSSSQHKGLARKMLPDVIDLAFATQRSLSDACGSVANQLENVYSPLSATKRELSSRIESVDSSMESIERVTADTEKQVSDLSNQVGTVGVDVNSIRTKIQNMETKINRIEGKQDTANEGVRKLVEYAWSVENGKTADRIQASSSGALRPALEPRIRHSTVRQPVPSSCLREPIETSDTTVTSRNPGPSRRSNVLEVMSSEPLSSGHLGRMLSGFSSFLSRTRSTAEGSSHQMGRQSGLGALNGL